MNKAVVKDALILTIITLIAGVLLGLVHEVTLEPIAIANENIRQNAFREVFTDAASFEDLEGFDAEEATSAIAADFPDDTIDGVELALDDSGELLGYVVTVTTSAGYGGNITLSMGIQNELDSAPKTAQQWHDLVQSVLGGTVDFCFRLIAAIAILMVGMWIANKITRSIKYAMEKRELEPSLISFSSCCFLRSTD